MPKFVIERIVPGIADWSEAQIRDASLKSLRPWPTSGRTSSGSTAS